MSYLDLLPDDVILSILDSSCDDIDLAIGQIEIAIEYYNDTINELEIFTDEDLDTDDEDEEEEDIELNNQYYQDQIYLDNLSSNI